MGESHYQKNLRALAGPPTEDGVSVEMLATLIPEPTNRYDRNAVRVEIGGLIVGYLDRDTAVDFGERLRALGHPGRSVTVPAVISGGWDRGGADRGMYGVRLDLVINSD